MAIETRPSFASLLKAYRVAQGLSQEALAERAGLTREAIGLLERGLRLSPRRDTVALLAKALHLSAEDRARLVAAASELLGRSAVAAVLVSGLPSSLPLRLTSFVGREKEIAALQAMLRSKRLVTLTGPGGIGKTSLALAVGSGVQALFSDGAVLVELAPLTDGGLVPQAIAAALGVREQRGEPIMMTLGMALGTTRRLLVLDNCEHLLENCAQVAEALLQACPRLTILVTSREPLRVAAEVIWRVPSLTLPNGDTELLDELTRSEAVNLFVERTEGVRWGFALTQSNAAAVAEICRRLDGIPLALELAAARVAALQPEQIAQHLHDRFRLLTTGSRTAVPRHRTLRALLDWSYELLTALERTLFNRLAVFAGGFTLEAATAVCGDTGDEEQISTAAVTRPSSALPHEDVLGLLLGLVDKSLVLVEARDGEARYRLLETLREYAREKLDLSGETPATRAAHAAYFAAWVGGPEPQAIELPMERAAALPLGAVAGEVDNLRTALSHFLDRGEAEMGLGLAARIYHLWGLRGPREEGREWLRRFLALPAAVAAPDRAAALFAAGFLAQFQGDLVEAEAAFVQAVTLARAWGDQRSQALAQTLLGVVAFLRGELARARAELEEGARLAREADAPAALLESLVRLGTLAVAQGDLMGGREALAEGRAVLPRHPVVRFRFHWLAGDLALVEGEGERAAREYLAGLADRRAAGDPVGVSISALGLAEVAAAAGEGVRAARLLGGSEGIALEVGGRLILEPMQRAQHARVEAAARELLGEEAFAALRAEGRRLRIEQVVRLALADLEPPRAPTSGEADRKRRPLSDPARSGPDAQTR